MALITGEEILDIAVRLEESGEAFYTAVAQQADADEVKALFEELAVQERQHRRTFQQMRDMPLKLSLSQEQWSEFQGYVQALLQQRFFAQPGGGLQRATDAEDEESALLAALDFEQEAILFYYELRDLASGSDRETIDEVIDEEKRHVRQLGEMLAARRQE